MSEAMMMTATPPAPDGRSVVFVRWSSRGAGDLYCGRGRQGSGVPAIRPGVVLLNANVHHAAYSFSALYCSAQVIRLGPAGEDRIAMRLQLAPLRQYPECVSEAVEIWS
jgi:hypothetical protein